MRLSMSEILENTSKISKRTEKIEYLRKHYTPQLHKILEFALNPDIKFSLPEGHPPYNALTEDEGHDILYRESRKLYLFVEGGYPALDDAGKQGQVKREALFIDMLEQVHPGDARLLIGMKDKNVPHKGITKKLIDEAFGEYRG